MNTITRCFLSLIFCSLSASAQDKVFSGPQPGEKTTAFTVLDIKGREDRERNPIVENAGAPTALVFVHALERSMVPVLRGLDNYGAQRKDRINMEIIFLAADRLAGLQRAKAAVGSLQLQSRFGVSPEGAEGPGNYGLNKDCLMTIISAKGNIVTANFALVQPGVADLPRIIEALAKTCGDANPPSIQQLTAQSDPAAGRMRPNGRRATPINLAQFDLNSESGLRSAVQALITEVTALRGEVAELRGSKNELTQAPAEPRSTEDFPGAVPSDPQLQSMLRQFIRPTNDDATVDKILSEVKTYITGNPDLEKQAVDGWVRILHFGDRYGTAYARKVGQQFLDTLKKG